jgi:hypothetical protein
LSYQFFGTLQLPLCIVGYGFGFIVIGAVIAIV